MQRHLKIWRALGLALALFTGLIVGAQPAAPVAVAQDRFSPTVELTGLVQNPKTFTRDDLAAYPSITLTVSVGAGQQFQTGRFTGVLLWDLLKEADVKGDPARNNDKLRKYVVMTATDGYEAITSVGEIDPDFGGEIVMIAYDKDGQPLGPGEGMARSVVDSDKRGGRAVSNLVRIEVRDADSPPRTAGGM